MPRLFFIERMKKRSPPGFTLIEFMVALLIGGLVTAAAFTAFLGTRQASRYSSALSRYQETLRYAQDKMSEDIRMAGSTGCFQIRKMGTATISNYGGAAGVSPDLSFTQALNGYENTGAASWAPALPAAIVPSKGDVIRATYADANGLPLSAVMAANTGPVIVTGTTPQFSSNDIAVIEQCDKADVFQITAAASAAGSQTLTIPALSTTYPAGAIPAAGVNVHKFVNHYWSIQTSTSSGLQNVLTRTSVVGSGSLSTPKYVSEDMVNGIEDMQITYGEDRSGSGSAGSLSQATQFSPANSVTDWSNVVSVRVCLMTVSNDDGLTTAKQKYFDCNGILQPAAPDYKLRFPLTFTVMLRNNFLQ
jgi:type IV pilus assembly protein PilW